MKESQYKKQLNFIVFWGKQRENLSHAILALDCNIICIILIKWALFVFSAFAICPRADAGRVTECGRKNLQSPVNAWKAHTGPPALRQGNTAQLHNSRSWPLPSLNWRWPFSPVLSLFGEISWFLGEDFGSFKFCNLTTSKNAYISIIKCFWKEFRQTHLLTNSLLCRQRSLLLTQSTEMKNKIKDIGAT